MAEEPVETSQARPDVPAVAAEIPIASVKAPAPATTPVDVPASTSEANVADGGEPPKEPIEEPSGKSLLVRVRDFVVTTIVLLLVASLFEFVTSKEGLASFIEAALAAQNVVTSAVANLNPQHFIRYWYDGFTFIAQPLKYAPSWIAYLQFPIRLLVGFLALCALPIVVIREGTPFEWLLVFGFYLPMFFWLKSRAKDPQGDELWGRSLSYAFLFTVLFYWGVQLLLNLTVVIFHQVIALAQLAVGGSIAITAVVWAAGKRGEHTVTEIALRLIRRGE